MPQPLPSRRHATRRFDSPQQEAYLNLWRTYDRLRMLEDELFQRHELTAQQYNALRLLRAEHPGTLPTLVLAGKLVSHAPDITRLVDRLEERGLVARQRMPDNRRVVQVGITDVGLELLKQLEHPVRECHLKQLGHLSTTQLQSLIELLRTARQPHEEKESTWG
jgi:DNA-binding MarR family transcriptional regulator